MQTALLIIALATASCVASNDNVYRATTVPPLLAAETIEECEIDGLTATQDATAETASAMIDCIGAHAVADIYFTADSGLTLFGQSIDYELLAECSQVRFEALSLEKQIQLTQSLQADEGGPLFEHTTKCWEVSPVRQVEIFAGLVEASRGTSNELSEDPEFPDMVLATADDVLRVRLFPTALGTVGNIGLGLSKDPVAIAGRESELVGLVLDQVGVSRSSGNLIDLILNRSEGPTDDGFMVCVRPNDTYDVVMFGPLLDCDKVI